MPSFIFIKRCEKKSISSADLRVYSIHNSACAVMEFDQAGCPLIGKQTLPISDCADVQNYVALFCLHIL